MSGVDCAKDRTVSPGEPPRAMRLLSSSQMDGHNLQHPGPVHRLFFLLGKLFPRTSQTWLLLVIPGLALVSPLRRSHAPRGDRRTSVTLSLVTRPYRWLVLSGSLGLCFAFCFCLICICFPTKVQL